MMEKIYMDYGEFSLQVELLTTPAASKLVEILPQTIAVTRWGEELYGPLSEPLEVSTPVAAVSPGSIAYSEVGHYLCVFFGQQPAWPIELLGHIADPHRQKLREATADTIKVRRQHSNKGDGVK
ncbi:MAG: cyclophilin-like fold protein [Chitinispirillaceae bacterium]